MFTVHNLSRITGYQGRQTRQNSGGGVAKVTNIDVTIPGSIIEKVHFLAFLRKVIKKINFYAKRIKKRPTFKFLRHK